MEATRVSHLWPRGEKLRLAISQTLEEVWLASNPIRLLPDHPFEKPNILGTFFDRRAHRKIGRLG